MTRLIIRTTLMLLLTATAGVLAQQVATGHGLAPLLGAVSCAYAGAITFVYALAAAWHVGRADACRWSHRRHWQPDGRVRVVQHDVPPSERLDPATVAADARAIDDYATPGTGRRALVLSPTVPMPVEELTAAKFP